MRILLLCLLLAAPSPAGRRISITIDDLPCAGPCASPAEARSVTDALLETLRKHRAPAVGFVIGSGVRQGESDDRTPLLDRWLAAGMELGNHTWSHADANETAAENYARDIDRTSALLSPLLARHHGQIQWFRFPFTHTGGSAAQKLEMEAVLKERGLRNAPFTIEHEDYLYNAALAKAIERADRATAARIEQAYLEHLDALLPFGEEVSRRLFGREIPQILLIHASRLNANCLPAMLKRCEARGYGFIRLEEAMADDAYRTPDLYVDRFGPSWFHRWGIALAKPFPMRGEPEAPAWVRDLVK